MDDQDLSEDLQKLLKNSSFEWDKPYGHHTVGKDLNALKLKIPTKCPIWLIKADGTGDEQTNDRMLSLWSDDSMEQKERVKAAIYVYFSGTKSAEHDEEEEICETMFRLIEPTTVKIPFISEINTPESNDPRTLNMFFVYDSIIRSFG